jgi:pyruvate ferredoxin oxidoreductase gamma subunit
MTATGITFHGRGGQGVVTAAELTSVAAFHDGRQAMAIPSFGSERMGAPVVAYCRIDDRPIRLREPVQRADAVVVLDPTLLHSIDVLRGCAPGALVLVNSDHEPAYLPLSAPSAGSRLRVVTVPASGLARHHLGKPLPNVCMLGALCALTRWFTLGSLERAIGKRFPPDVAGGNLAATAAAYRMATQGAAELSLGA